MAFDVGQITRQLQQEFMLFEDVGQAPARDDVIDLELGDEDGEAINRATPENLAVLLEALDDMTAQTAAKRTELGAGGLPDILDGAETAANIAQWDLDMLRWRGRLGAYHDQVDKAPPGDRADVLWSVTAPLLIGFFGGEASKLPQQPIDAITPFTLANQLNVAIAWEQERRSLFFQEIQAGIKDVVEITAGIGTGALVVGGIVVGGIALARLVRR